MTPEQECKNKASRLHDEFSNSKHVPVDEHCKDGGSFKAGDILSGDNFAIYHKSIGNGEHELIEKSEKKDDRGTHIRKFIVSTDQLKQNYKIVIDCRHKATCDMALKIYNEKLDAGYSITHSNSEHFVTFCLTRHGHYSRSRQEVIRALIRDTAARVSVPFGHALKVITHQLYMIQGGDMDLNSRLLKTALPFGLDSDEIVNGIKDGSKIFIGYCNRAIPEAWFPHDE